MTPQQIQMIQQSWAQVRPIAPDAARLFYGRLFELDPNLKPLFKGDMEEQGRKLMGMINTVVNGLTNLEPMLPAIQNLGRRHVDYGVRDEHYATVGAALLWTLGQGLGEDFTPEVEGAWAEAYGLLAGVMTEAAREPA